MSTGARKFTFDTEFAGGEDRRAPEAKARQKQTFTSEELDALKSLARHEGASGAEIRAAEALERGIAALTISVRAALDTSHAEIEALRDEAARLALAMAKKIAPAVIQVLEPRLSDIAHEEGYDGRVLFAADVSMSGADCRIEWRGGGAERSEQTIEEALNALIAHRFSHTVKG